MAELNFIEYNINSETHVEEDIAIRLYILGFKKISVGTKANMSMWAMNKLIILVSNDNSSPTGISGMGFNTDNSFDGSVHCDMTGLSKFKFNNLNLYTFPVDQFRQTYDNHFKTVQSETSTSNLLDHTAGLIVNGMSTNLMNTFINTLHMRVVKKSADYVTTVCQNNRLNILWNTAHTDKSGIDTIVTNVENIIDTTAEYAASGLKFMSSNVEHTTNFYSKFSTDEYYNNLPTKSSVNAYGITIAGKPKSYVLEKCISQALPNLNIIMSQRFNHNGVNEDAITYHKSKIEMYEIDEDSSNVIS